MRYFDEKWAYLDRQRGEAPSYVTDGLQLWLDGINNTRHGHSPYARVWEDLSGNDFDFGAKTMGQYPTVGDKYFTGFSSTKFFVSTNSTLINMGSTTVAGTLEVVYQTNISHTGLVFGFRNVTGSTQPLYKMIVKSQNAVIVAARHSSTTNSRYTTGNVTQAADEPTFVSVAYGGSIDTIDTEINGSDYSLTGGNTGWGNNVEVNIGNREHTSSSTAYPFNGKIYAIRYYNRVLTDAERLQNRMLDERRFA